MTVSTSNRLLSYYLNAAAAVMNEGAVKKILEVWTQDYPMEKIIPFRTLIYTIGEIDIDTLKYVESIYNDRGYLAHMMDLVSHDSTPEVETACLKLYKVYGEQHPDDYQDILDEINVGAVLIDTPNFVMRDFVTERYRGVSGYADVPSWIVNETEGDRLPTHDEQIGRASCRERVLRLV